MITQCMYTCTVLALYLHLLALAYTCLHYAYTYITATYHNIGR